MRTEVLHTIRPQVLIFIEVQEGIEVITTHQEVPLPSWVETFLANLVSFQFKKKTVKSPFKFSRNFREMTTKQ